MSLEALTIRPAQPADYPAIAALLNDAYLWAGTVLSETVATVSERSEDALVIVVEDHGVIVGTLTAAAAGSYYGRLARPGQMEVSRLAVHRAHQSRGIGKAMLKTVAETSKRQGVTALVGASLHNMTTAHNLYKSIGAKPGVIPGAKARGYILQLTESQQKETHAAAS